ncbi:VOC family protein [Candidatus Bathyarchaeota archaeon]|nr:VOC family protein [Candidatus Bathyarchaeota archaeon]
MPILGLAHFMIQANDLKATLHFYNKVMEMPLVQLRGTEDNPQFLKFRDIEITQRKDPTKIPSPDVCSISHIAFHVDNIEEVVKRMKKKGASFLTPINVTKEGVKWIMCRDPDGNKIEVTDTAHL